MSKKTGSLTYERAIEILQYDAENGVLMRKLKTEEWRICGNKPTRSDGRGVVDMATHSRGMARARN